MSNEYYDHGSFPATGSSLSSAAMRAELESIEAGLDKLPVLAGNANKAVVVNPSGTALTVSTTASDHAANTSNPHSVTKAQVGLGNVDNTSDANKPVSTATQTALNAKVTGPASATDNALARFDGTTGKLVQNSGVTVDDNGNMTVNGTSGFGVAAGTVIAARAGAPTGTDVGKYAFAFDGTFNSSTTSFAVSYLSSPSTAAASFTLGNLIHFRAAQGTFGAGSTVTNQYGFIVDAGLTGATNNYGYLSSIPAGANRWNFYASGTAANYFAGNVGVGSTLPSARLEVARLGTDMAVTGVTATTAVLVHPGGGSTSSSSEITVVGGTAATAGLWLGTTANAVASGLIYSASTGVLSLRNNGEFTDRLTISNTGAVAVVGGGTLGYGAGSGGTVTQATSKSTAVTLNKPSGYIVMDSAALAAGATAVFTVNNSVVVVPDGVVLGLVGGIADPSSYRVELRNSYAGAFVVRVTNISGGSLSEAVIINFNVIKGSTT